MSFATFRAHTLTLYRFMIQVNAFCDRYGITLMIELYPSFKNFVVLLLHYLFQAEQQDDAIAHPILAMAMCLWTMHSIAFERSLLRNWCTKLKISLYVIHRASMEFLFMFQNPDDLGSAILKYKTVSGMCDKLLDMVGFLCLARVVEKIVRLAIAAHTRFWDRKQMTREKIARADLVDMAKRMVQDGVEKKMKWVPVDGDEEIVIGHLLSTN